MIVRAASFPSILCALAFVGVGFACESKPDVQAEAPEEVTAEEAEVDDAAKKAESSAENGSPNSGKASGQQADGKRANEADREAEPAAPKGEDKAEDAARQGVNVPGQEGKYYRTKDGWLSPHPPPKPSPDADSSPPPATTFENHEGDIPPGGMLPARR